MRKRYIAIGPAELEHANNHYNNGSMLLYRAATPTDGYMNPDYVLSATGGKLITRSPYGDVGETVGFLTEWGNGRAVFRAETMPKRWSPGSAEVTLVRLIRLRDIGMLNQCCPLGAKIIDSWDRSAYARPLGLAGYSAADNPTLWYVRLTIRQRLL